MTTLILQINQKFYKSKYFKQNKFIFALQTNIFSMLRLLLTLHKELTHIGHSVCVLGTHWTTITKSITNLSNSLSPLFNFRPFGFIYFWKSKVSRQSLVLTGRTTSLFIWPERWTETKQRQYLHHHHWHCNSFIFIREEAISQPRYWGGCV